MTPAAKNDDDKSKKGPPGDGAKGGKGKDPVKGAGGPPERSEAERKDLERLAQRATGLPGETVGDPATKGGKAASKGDGKGPAEP